MSFERFFETSALIPICLKNNNPSPQTLNKQLKMADYEHQAGLMLKGCQISKRHNILTRN